MKKIEKERSNAEDVKQINKEEKKEKETQRK